jgi:hypothetical protein
MKYFNLYYKESKINKYPLTQEELEEVFNMNKDIIKNDLLLNTSETIPLNKVRIVKTIMI